MKTLKRLHLKPEQELSDTEMKQILAKGAIYYFDCHTGAQYHSACNVGMDCMFVHQDSGFSGKQYFPGTCKFEYYKMSDANESCFCKYWEGAIYD